MSLILPTIQQRRARLNVESMCSFDAGQYANIGVSPNINNAIDSDKEFGISFFVQVKRTPAISGELLPVLKVETGGSQYFSTHIGYGNNNALKAVFYERSVVQRQCSSNAVLFRWYANQLVHVYMDRKKVVINGRELGTNEAENIASYMDVDTAISTIAINGDLLISHLCIFNRFASIDEANYMREHGGLVPESLHINTVAHYPMTHRSGDKLLDVSPIYNYAKPEQLLKVDLDNGFPSIMAKVSYNEISTEYNGINTIKTSWDENPNSTYYQLYSFDLFKRGFVYRTSFRIYNPNATSFPFNLKFVNDSEYDTSYIIAPETEEYINTDNILTSEYLQPDPNILRWLIRRLVSVEPSPPPTGEHFFVYDIEVEQKSYDYQPYHAQLINFSNEDLGLPLVIENSTQNLGQYENGIPENYQTERAALTQVEDITYGTEETIQVMRIEKISGTNQDSYSFTIPNVLTVGRLYRIYYRIKNNTQKDIKIRIYLGSELLITAGGFQSDLAYFNQENDLIEGIANGTDLTFTKIVYDTEDTLEIGDAYRLYDIRIIDLDAEVNEPANRIQSVFKDFYTKELLQPYKQVFSKALSQHSNFENENIESVVDYTKEFSVSFFLIFHDNIFSTPIFQFESDEVTPIGFHIRILLQSSNNFRLLFFERGDNEGHRNITTTKPLFLNTPYFCVANRNEIIINGELYPVDISTYATIGTYEGANKLLYFARRIANSSDGYEFGGITLSDFVIYNKYVSLAESKVLKENKGVPQAELHPYIFAHYVPDPNNLQMLDLVEHYNYAKPVSYADDFSSDTSSKYNGGSRGTITYNASALAMEAHLTVGDLLYDFTLPNALINGYYYTTYATIENPNAHDIFVSPNYGTAQLTSMGSLIPAGQTVNIEVSSYIAINSTHQDFRLRRGNADGNNTPVPLVAGEYFIVHDLQIVPEQAPLSAYHAPLINFTNDERLVQNPDFATDLEGWALSVTPISGDAFNASLYRDVSGSAILEVTEDSTIENSRMVLETPFYAKKGEVLKLRLRMKCSRVSNRHIYFFTNGNTIVQVPQNTDFVEYEYIYKNDIGDCSFLRLNINSKLSVGSGEVDTLITGDTFTIDYMEAIPLKTDRNLLDSKSLLAPTLKALLFDASLFNSAQFDDVDLLGSNENGYTFLFTFFLDSNRDFSTDAVLSIIDDNDELRFHGFSDREFTFRTKHNIITNLDTLDLSGLDLSKPVQLIFSLETDRLTYYVNGREVLSKYSDTDFLINLPDFVNPLVIGDYQTADNHEIGGGIAQLGIAKGIITAKQALECWNNSLLANPVKSQNLDWFMWFGFDDIQNDIITNKGSAGGAASLINYTADQRDPAHIDYALKDINSLR